MAARTIQGANSLFGFRRKTRFDSGLGASLPAAYLKFYKEWRQTKPAAVHYIPKEGKYERDELTGIVRPVQNVSIPVIYPPEHDDAIWGGEGVVKGFQKRHHAKRRVPHFWVPVLRRSVVYSAVLNRYMSVVVTNRTMDLIHDNHGFDHYLLKTPACDLKSKLPLRIKREILQELQDGCPKLEDQPKKQKDVLDEYKKYLDAYTPEEIEWYGYSFNEAIHKLHKENLAKIKVVPQKEEFRSILIQQLKAAGIAEAQDSKDPDDIPADKIPGSSWISKINPFSKKRET